jgi:hypothetical protein
MMNNTPVKSQILRGYENSSFIIHNSSLKRKIYTYQINTKLMVRLLTNDLSSRRLRIGKLFTGFCLAILLTINGIAHAQSASFGSSYAYGGGITSIIGQHDFQTGSGTLSQGIIGSERPTNSGYGFLQGASWLNASDNAFIDGYATTYGTGAFTFPIGDNGKYRPAAVSASATSAPTSAAYYGADPTTAITSALQGGNEIALPTGAPFAITAKATGISSVTNKEYWDIKGTTAAKISLTWNTTSAISTLTSATLANLTIVGWNGTQWVRIPSTVDATSILGAASTYTEGSITTDAAITPNTYTVYSFGSVLACAVATVGGTAAYAGGTLCTTSNIGTALLTGNTGNIVRWETSTNGGSSWSPITNINTYHNFANAANAQQYRAVVNNGAGCLDENSAAATITTSATNCTATSCDNTTGNVTLTIVTPPSNANTKSVLIFTNSSGVIQYASAVNSMTINGVAVGDYLVYNVVYDDTQLPLPTLTVGTNVTAVGGACAKFTNQLAYKVCPAATGAPDLTTTIGQPSPALQVGVTSNLPITVANIGTGPAPGVITTMIILPTGVTAPANFTTNGWTCSTTAPTVTCTNPGPINAGRDSTFFVPITPNASLSGTNPTFNATTNPVTGETVTNNNAATPTTTTLPVIGGSLLTMKVLLQGNYDPNTGWMHDSLRKKGLIPLSDPYRTAAYSTKFTHKKNGGTQTTTNAILAVTGANAIVDWVFIELHSSTNPATVIGTKAALLQRDGDIVSSDDGVSPVYMDSISSGNYYISIRHRNHLGTMTATTRPLSATSTVVDFTTMTAAQLWNKAGGDGYEQTKSGIRNLLWAGDTDGNRQTVFSGPANDVDPVFFDVMTNVANVNFVPNYIVKSQYLASDVNLDGRVIYQSADNEVDIILFMVLSHTLNTGFIPSYIIVEQLP